MSIVNIAEFANITIRKAIVHLLTRLMGGDSDGLLEDVGSIHFTIISV